MPGLNNEQVLISRHKYGSNQLNKSQKNSFRKLLIESLGDPIIRILLIALAIKIIFLFKDFDWYETIGILIAVFLATFISTISEYGSEAAFEKLQAESAKIKVKAFRQNKLILIDIEDVVVDDLIILASGDKIPADGYLLKGNISVDESSLNGETKEAKKVARKSEIEPLNAANLVYRGSVVYTGEATMKVSAVGNNTIYGKLALELQEKNPPSPLKIRLRGLAQVISKIGYIGAILVTISYLFSVIVLENNFQKDLILATLTNFKIIANHLIYALTLSVTIIVVAVPEGLPMMITLVLSSNMKRMLKDHVLVRKLVGIETAGSLNVLLTDKTGTLTKGKLEVSQIYDAELKEYINLKELKKNNFFSKQILEQFYFNNESSLNEKEIIGGNSTDQALLSFIKDQELPKVQVIEKTLFESAKKYSSATIDNGKKITYYKGAQEVILPKCLFYQDEQKRKKLLTNTSFIDNKILSLTKKGIRIIFLAVGESSKFENLTFLGFVCIKDELREEAKEGISLIKSAGIHTIMITGDAKETAEAIALEVGLINDKQDLIWESKEFNQMSDEEIKNKILRVKVIARALPTDKSRLVNILEEMNLIVGMTGDGVNDAPALKKANVGFAMGNGTEVAKEAADIVILDNNILSISKAILYGRTIFKSIRKFIIYQLTVNMCALFLSIIGPFIGINTPITIIQMLWLNMIMDTFAGLAFSFEPAIKDYMHELPKSKKEPIINSYMYGEIIIMSLYSALLCILFLKLPIIKTIIRVGPNNKYLMTAYFALFIFMGVFNSFNARSERLNILANLRKNKIFIGIIIFIVTVQIYLIYHGGDLFRTYGLKASEFAIVLILAFTVIPIDFFRKIYLRRHHLVKGV